MLFLRSAHITNRWQNCYVVLCWSTNLCIKQNRYFLKISVYFPRNQDILHIYMHIVSNTFPFQITLLFPQNLPQERTPSLANSTLSSRSWPRIWGRALGSLFIEIPLKQGRPSHKWRVQNQYDHYQPSCRSVSARLSAFPGGTGTDQRLKLLLLSLF